MYGLPDRGAEEVEAYIGKLAQARDQLADQTTPVSVAVLVTQNSLPSGSRITVQVSGLS